jgi:hypothetical protein
MAHTRRDRQELSRIRAYYAVPGDPSTIIHKWRPDTQYEAGTIAISDGQIWECVFPNKGLLPSINPHWWSLVGRV